MSYVEVWECKLYSDARNRNSPNCGLFAPDLTSLSNRNVFKTPSK